MNNKAHFLEPLLRAGQAGHSLLLERSAATVASEIELAADSQSRNRGLLGRSGIAADSAMVIAPCNAIHTFFMRFTIDVVFVDRQGRVLRLCHSVRPWRVCVALRAFAAVELSAGSISRLEITKGDVLTIVKRSLFRPE